jgi:hypothetical protein
VVRIHAGEPPKQRYPSLSDATVGYPLLAQATFRRPFLAAVDEFIDDLRIT